MRNALVPFAILTVGMYKFRRSKGKCIIQDSIGSFNRGAQF